MQTRRSWRAALEDAVLAWVTMAMPPLRDPCRRHPTIFNKINVERPCHTKEADLLHKSMQNENNRHDRLWTLKEGSQDLLPTKPQRTTSKERIDKTLYASFNHTDKPLWPTPSGCSLGSRNVGKKKKTLLWRRPQNIDTRWILYKWYPDAVLCRLKRSCREKFWRLSDIILIMTSWIMVAKPHFLYARPTSAENIAKYITKCSWLVVDRLLVAYNRPENWRLCWRVSEITSAG